MELVYNGTQVTKPKASYKHIEIIHFFRDICSSKLQTQHIERLETNIIETICKLEMIVPS
jgi:hypothetical protein